MPNGYTGKILRVNLSNRSTSVEEPDENFYRRYYGGTNIVAHYLLKEVAPGIDPLGPENKLIFATGPFTGVPLAGSGRHTVGAKSPLTGGFGDGQAGGYFGVELKVAGYDAIIIEGKADKPVYLWINTGGVEIRDASHLWGKLVAETEDAIRAELGDKLIRVSQIGPGGENLVRYAAIINDSCRAVGRTGMGAVMGSKNLKAVAVRGKKQLLPIADRGKIKEMNKWISEVGITYMHGLHTYGTPAGIRHLQTNSGLPTRNFREGQFEGFEKIAGDTMQNTISVGHDTCFACPTFCKRVVKVEDRYSVDPRYGGPEYESIGALGSLCGVDDLQAIAKANELCAANSLDTMSAGASIAFAMECFENGIISENDTDGLRLTFGNGEAVVKMVEAIAKRQGFGNVLAEGVKRAAQQIGRGAEKYAFHIKGQEMPMHEPRYKMGAGIGFAVSPTGADHNHNFHDNLFARPGPHLDRMKAYGILDPLDLTDTSDAKVRLLLYESEFRTFMNCFIICQFIPFEYNQLVDIVRATTGWNAGSFELKRIGERAITMQRAFNIREGFGRKDDTLPDRFYEPFKSGPLAGVAPKKDDVDRAITSYYEMLGWEPKDGVPTKTRLSELGVGWVADELEKAGRLGVPAGV